MWSCYGRNQLIVLNQRKFWIENLFFFFIGNNEWIKSHKTKLQKAKNKKCKNKNMQNEQ